MKLGWRDAVATLLVAAIGVPYAFYLALGGVTFIQNGDGSTAVGILDPTGMSGLALVLGAIAAIVGGWIVLGEGSVTGYVTGGLGVVSAVLGALALVGENLLTTRPSGRACSAPLSPASACCGPLPLFATPAC